MTTDLQSRPRGIGSDYEKVRKLLGSYGPERLEELRDEAIRAFAAVGIPTTKDEEFKYLPLRVLEEGQFASAYGATVSRHEAESGAIGKIEAATIAFVNGQAAPELSHPYVLPGGVFLGTLEDGFGVIADVLDEHLGKIATLAGKLGTTNDDRFVQLNTAYLSEGAVLFVPKGVVVETPIHIQYLNRADHGPCAIYPRTLIVLEADAQAKVVESHVGLDGIVFSNAVTEIWLGHSAKLEHCKVQIEGEHSVHIAKVGAHQEVGSTLTSNNVNFGGKIVRNDIDVFLGGEHTETWLNGANVGSGEQVVDNHTRIDHAMPNCHSFEVYKTVLADKAQGVFNGKIFVYKDAQKTDAKQTNQALLLSPTAAINTKPQLEIFADDVKCTHGASIGQLREDALFYLRSRGIPYAEARSLLVYAFVAEVLDKITVPDLRDSLERMLFEKLRSVSELPPAEETGA